MSETGRSTSSDQTYFRAIEETFIRLRGSPFLLSPTDWQVAQGWRQSGIPIELVVETLDSVFQSRADSGKTGKVQSLRYVSGAVEQAWEEQKELLATGRRDPQPAIDSSARLETLARALPQSFRDRGSFVEQIVQLSGPPEEIEEELIELDRRLLRAAFDAMPPGEQSEIQKRVESTLDRLGTQLDEFRIGEIRQRLHDQTVRREADLPILSLFSTR